MRNSIVLATLLALLAFPLLSHSKCCRNDFECQQGNNICIKRKCVIGERFVAIMGPDGSVAIIDPANPVVHGVLNVPFASDISVSPDNIVYVKTTKSTLYALDFSAQTVTLVDAFDFPIYVGGMAWGPDNLLYIVAHTGVVGANLFGVDPKTAYVEKLIPMPNLSRKGGDVIWVPNLEAFLVNSGTTGELYKVTIDGKVTRIANIGEGIRGLAYFGNILYAYGVTNKQFIMNLDDFTLTYDKDVIGWNREIYAAG